MSCVLFWRIVERLWGRLGAGTEMEIGGNNRVFESLLRGDQARMKFPFGGGFVGLAEAVVDPG